jgi:hypothetical protein
LDADFKGLRKDGEILVIWQADNRRGDPDVYERFDRIIFFANGDFHTYRRWPELGGEILRGNLARISYMLARNSYDPDQGIPLQQEPHERILVRTQNVLTDNNDLPPTNVERLESLVVPVVDPEGWHGWRDEGEFETMSMQEWGMISIYDWSLKSDILSVLLDVAVSDSPLIYPGSMIAGGTTVERNNPNLFHLILSEGVGEFQVQGWHEAKRLWLPSIDPNGDGLWDDTNFYLEGPDVNGVLRSAGLLYTPQTYRGTGKEDDGFLVMWDGIGDDGEYVEFDDFYEQFDMIIDQEHFNEIPGLGRALKFTFTLYDSRGVFENGRTFSHIVYLDD